MTILAGARILADDLVPFLNSQMGSVTVSFTTQTSFSVAVTFPVAFPIGAAVNVHTNINNGTASTAGWASKAISTTNTGFTLVVSGGSSTWSSVPVQWTAFSAP